MSITMLTTASGARIVLLFSNVAAPHLAARLHVETCPMLRTAGRGTFRAANIDRDVDQDTIDDLNARGWQVKYCKCCK